MSPTDPRRIPVEHRELVNRMFGILSDNGYNIFEAQVITQALSVLARTSDISKGMDTLSELVECVSKVENGHRDMEAILQILGFKMTESLNSLKLGSMEFEEISLN